MSKIKAILLLVFSASISLANSPETILVGFISRENQDFYEKVVSPYWGQLSAGSNIQLVPLAIVNSKGEINLDRLTKNIQNAPKNMKSIYVHWNEKFDPVHVSWLAELRKKTEVGVKVAFFAGMAKPGLRTLALNKTLVSQVPKALVIGELMDRERLPPQHFYGPELFTALKFDATVGATGLAPLNFVSRWVIQSPLISLDESIYQLRKKKMKSASIWPTTNDFFGRR